MTIDQLLELGSSVIVIISVMKRPELQTRHALSKVRKSRGLHLYLRFLSPERRLKAVLIHDRQQGTMTSDRPRYKDQIKPYDRQIKRHKNIEV